MGGGALEVVFILGRLDGANLDNHLDFPLGEPCPIEDVVSTGDAISEDGPFLSPASLSSCVSEAMFC